MKFIKLNYFINKPFILIYALIAIFFSRISFVKDVIVISENQKFNGNNKIFLWIGSGDCSQKEGMPPMFIMQNNSELKNVNILNAPDGIHIVGSNVKISNMRNYDVCEDAISTKKFVENIEIKDSLFLRCSDKVIQLNYGDKFTITNNKLFYADNQ